MSKILAWLVFISAALVSGCATAPMATAERDVQAKMFATTPGQANLYVYRNEMFGAAVSMDLMMDGRLVGKTVAQSYFVVPVQPGKHTLVSKAENDSSIDFNAEPGKNYFVWQEVKMGLLYARTQLHLVDEGTGQAGVRECKLLQAGP